MPQSSSEQSLVTNFYPVLMGNSDILVKDDYGHTNPLEVGDYTRNRELVNLENASVNIDNSSDVIIGPVTQFNVNGNVTIYQNENGQQRPDDGGGLPEVNNYDDRQGKSRIRISWLNFIFMTLDQNRRLVRNISLLSAAIFLVLIVVLILIRKFVHDAVDYDYDFKDAFYGDHLGNHSVFYRKDWGGLPPKMNTVPLEHCTPLLIISHSATRQCAAVDGCIRKVKYLQRDHQINVNTLDIGLNFVIGGDSNIYVGRGWDIENYRRKNSLLVGFIGDYVFDILTKDMIDAAEQLISQGVQLGKLCLDYEMVGENQTSPSKFLSPGENVYKVIKTWPHFVNKTIF